MRTRDKVNIPLVHSDIQEVCGNSVEVYLGTVGHNCSIDFSPDAQHLSVVEKSAFADIFGKAAWSHM